MGEVVDGNFDTPEARNANFGKAINDFRDDLVASVEMFVEREPGSDEKFAWLFVFTGAVECLKQAGADMDYLRELLESFDEETSQTH